MKTPAEVIAEIARPHSFGTWSGLTGNTMKIVRDAMRLAIEADRAQRRSVNFRPRFEPGERVELVERRGAYGPKQLRPGTVVAIDDEPVTFHHLRVRFDDGEERQINPDVMRRIR